MNEASVRPPAEPFEMQPSIEPHELMARVPKEKMAELVKKLMGP